ncbi:SUMF1/EgtB/PvdO family nonheme iron enzyme [Scytonema sp. UIC 10036]|uniref:SUMF1/EgtB/PvdO family nonheme iron enzyme n=1 Tax=Scytonema sp. UIC 10036 TaxID=2304196 RepID=UPI001A9AECAB|nr:SUMF1/EgtB/PvdO family nonheme iron enzyme [Scytonema sp. UIC 10036]
MIPNDPHLLELFWGLRQAGLLLRIEDYQLLSQAWEKGFRPENYQDLRKLCRRLWVKNRAEKQCFENYFDQYLKQQQLSQSENKISSAAKSPSTQRTTDAKTTESEPVTTEASPTQANLPRVENLDRKEEPQEVAQAVSLSLPSQRFTLTDEYFPVTRRQMQQGWRKLRQPVREGAEIELDISATVKRISQEGFFLEPVLIPSRINQTELLLLIDRSNSTIPFAPIAERLAETAQQEGRLGKTKIYYFRNSPTDSLYSDLNLLQKQPLTDIIPHLHSNHTVVVIFSDGGAARGGFNPKRVELLENFLDRIRPVVRQVAWLNPLPANRWRGNTASWVTELVSMYPFDLTGWRRTIDDLRGRQKLVKEYDDSANGLELVANPQFIQQVRGRLQQVLEKLKHIPIDEYSRYESAARYIIDFSKHGQAYLDFACHAAFPLALTPDLSYYLRENFKRDRQGTSLNIPWLAIPDLLLSNLCNPAGQPLYEMDSAVRHLLLKLLQTDERFGNPRLEELSECLLFYLQQRLEQTNLDIKDFGEKPEWIALAYTKPKELAYHLATMLEQMYLGDKADKVRTTSLTATFADPLVEEGFQPLLTFASAWGRLARGYDEGARELFDELSPNLSELDIEGVKLTIPGRSNLPQLSQFSFDVVTVNALGKIIKREKHQANYFTEYLPDNVTLEMVSIPGGTFLMGSPETEEGHQERESPQHEVTVQPFFMGKYPITQAQWRAIAGLPQVNRELDPDPSLFKGSDLPVECVSWYDAVEFCDRLSIHTKRNYRLPSGAEWEYSCRSGTTTPFHFGETITPELANYNGNSTYGSGSKGKYRERTTPVGSLKVANVFGLFDMHGNVWEWCADTFHNSYKDAL